jgi:hypothetical protein
MNGAWKAFALALAGEIGSLLVAYLKYGPALEIWLLALGLLFLGLILSAVVPAFRGLVWPLAFGVLLAIGAVASHLAYLA